MEDAVDEEDILPERNKYVGRRVHKMLNPFGRGTRGHAPKCCECPKWAVKTEVCLIRGAYQPRNAPACMYGITIIRAKRKAEKRERLRGEA
jgi:hypothetical protein